jgi:crossover junction endodeoxyribonuclease RuvC
MIILGIDPALAVTGYGVIQFDKKQIFLLEAGIVATSSKNTTSQRLDKIFRSIAKLIQETKPEVVVIEEIFSHYRHPTTSYILGQARGVICLAAEREKVPLIEYAATRIKKSIVGRGLASKLQVQKMVTKILQLETLPKYTDVTDALALAIAHCYIARIK